jgi:hypothetical protein
MKQTTDAKGQPIYLAASETRADGYFHITARFVTQASTPHGTETAGVDDDYSGGLLYSGIRVRCHGDSNSQLLADPVYGFDAVYHDLWMIDLPRARRVLKTLEKLDRGLDRLREARGYARTFGEYLGRVAEAMGCAGIAIETTPEGQRFSGERWRWQTIGEGVNSVNNRIAAWHQEAIDAAARAHRADEVSA